MADQFPVRAATNFQPQAGGEDTNRLLWKLGEMLFTGLGLAGSTRIGASGTVTGRYWIFHALTDSVIAEISYGNGTTGGVQAGDTIKAGDRIYGWINSITLTSGTGELYKAPSQVVA